MSVAGHRLRAIAGLAVLTASLFACSSAPSDPSAELVTASTVTVVSHDVENSTLPSDDKKRFAAFLDAHRTTPLSYAGKTVHEIINLQLAYENGVKMAANEKKDEAEHRATLAKLVRVAVTDSKDTDELVLTLRVTNLTAKTIKHMDLGLQADASGRRIGLCELALDSPVPPRTTQDVPMHVHYSHFGEDTTSMMHAAGKPRTYALDVKEIKYTDGTDAGYDD